MRFPFQRCRPIGISRRNVNVLKRGFNSHLSDSSKSNVKNAGNDSIGFIAGTLISHHIPKGNPLTAETTDWTFEDWTKAGEAYAASLGYPQQGIERIGSDLAWMYEGGAIKDIGMEKAYQSWLNGNNSYSPHFVPLDGYDYVTHCDRKNKEALVGVIQYANNVFNDNHDSIRKFTKHFDTDSLWIDLYDDSTLEATYHEFMKGTLEGSPHYIPLEPENIQAREERIKQLEESSPQDSFFYDLFYSIKSKGYGALNAENWPV